MRISAEHARKEFAQKLKQIRRELGLECQQMAALLKISDNTYYKNEAGESFPNYTTLKRLVIDHDISLDWLLFDKGPKRFKNKAKLDVLETQLTETKKILETTNREREEFVADFLKNQKTGIPDLLDDLQKDQRLYLRVMTAYQDYLDEKQK